MMDDGEIANYAFGKTGRGFSSIVFILIYQRSNYNEMKKVVFERIQDAQQRGAKRLDLSYLDIVGALPMELAALDQVEDLDLTGNKINDLSAIAVFKKLRRLNLYHAPITSLLYVEDLLNLKELNLSGTLITDFEPLNNFVKLKELELSFTSVVDLNCIRKLTNLEKLDLLDTKVHDLAPIAKFKKMKNLNLAMSAVQDLTPISGMVEMEEFSIVETSITDLSAMKEMRKLRKFYASYGKVVDLTPLTDLTSLEEAMLIRTQVQDVRPLAKLLNLRTLDLSETQVKDISPLEPLILQGMEVFVKDGFGPQGLNVEGCPLENPPLQVAAKGRKAILAHWKKENLAKQPGTEQSIAITTPIEAPKTNISVSVDEPLVEPILEINGMQPQSPIEVHANVHSRHQLNLLMFWKDLIGKPSRTANGLCLVFEPDSKVKIEFQGLDYHFSYSQFHHAALHRPDGDKYDAELHLVHKSPYKDGSTIVLAVLLRIDETVSKRFDEKFYSALESCGGNITTLTELPFNPKNWLPIGANTATCYEGSLQIDGKEREVTWVLIGTRKITEDQFQQIFGKTKPHNLPLQPRNRRYVVEYSWTPK